MVWYSMNVVLVEIYKNCNDKKNKYENCNSYINWYFNVINVFVL